MGSPRQTFAGETRLSRQCRWPRAAKGRSASHFKMYPGLLEQPCPCLPAQSIKVEEEKEEDAEKENGIVFTLHLREIFISPPKKNPANQPFPSVDDLSPTVFFEIKPFKKTETFEEEEDDLKPCFPF